MKMNVWKTFSLRGSAYMLKIAHNEVYNIYLSDLMDMWYDEYAKPKIAQIFHECNPTIVVNTEDAVSQVLKIFDKINEAESIVTKSDNTIIINITSEISGLDNTVFKVKYRLTLTKSEKKKFTEDITASMIHTINYLEKQQKMLCNMIIKKDRELEEYKMEKGLISRTDLITEKFSSDTIEKPNEKLLVNVYSESNKFWESFIKEYGNIEAKVIDIKVDPWNHVKRKRKLIKPKTSTKKLFYNIKKE